MTISRLATMPGMMGVDNLGTAAEETPGMTEAHHRGTMGLATLGMGTLKAGITAIKMSQTTTANRGGDGNRQSSGNDVEHTNDLWAAAKQQSSQRIGDAWLSKDQDVKSYGWHLYSSANDVTTHCLLFSVFLLVGVILGIMLAVKILY
jgi:hypothetical protein